MSVNQKVAMGYPKICYVFSLCSPVAVGEQIWPTAVFKRNTINPEIKHCWALGIGWVFNNLGLS